MTERFAQEGMTAVIADDRPPEAELVAEQIIHCGGSAIPIEVDVTHRDSLEAMADRADKERGGASILVNNAASSPPALS